MDEIHQEGQIPAICPHKQLWRLSKELCPTRAAANDVGAMYASVPEDSNLNLTTRKQLVNEMMLVDQMQMPRASTVI